MNNRVSPKAGYYNPKYNDFQAECSCSWDGLLMLLCNISQYWDSFATNLIHNQDTNCHSSQWRPFKTEAYDASNLKEDRVRKTDFLVSFTSITFCNQLWCNQNSKKSEASLKFITAFSKICIQLRPLMKTDIWVEN